jgi:3-oxoacyl-[acyl-carrier protein] reductase
MSVALVTGASRGIGRAVALRLAQDGHDIAVGYASQSDAADATVEAVRGQGARAVAVGGDLADPATAELVVDTAEAELGPVEILVANAGVSAAPTGIADISDKEWERMMAINLSAQFRLCRRLVPAMAERGWGRIVFVSSIAAYTGGLIGAHYAASKAALHGLAHNLAQQTAAHGVTVNVVAPALIESDMIPDDPQVREALANSAPVGRLGQPEEVADLVAAITANGYVTAQSIPIDGGRHPT